MRRSRNRSSKPRRGMVLIAVLIVLTVLSLAAYQYADLMMAESKAADAFRRTAQARALADSGIHYAAAVLSNPDTVSSTLGGNPYDNSQAFQAQGVSGLDGARFSLIAPLGPDETASSTNPYRFGVIDESGKINLNSLLSLDKTGQKGHDILMALPNMSEDVANSILDWMDPDDTPRQNGAESDYYSGLTPPYRAKNGPLDSLEELLLVKGVTPQLLYGNDRNRNGILDPEEDDGSGAVDRGWSAYLTVYTHESNFDSTGNPRIYINDPDVNSLAEKLTTALGSQDMVNFIIAYRMYGAAAQPATSGSGAGATGSGSTGKTSGSNGMSGGMASTPSMGSGSSGMGGAASGMAGGSSGMSGSAGSSGAGGLSAASRQQVSSQIQRDRQGSSQRKSTKINSLFDLINASVSVPTSTTGTVTTAFSANGQQVAQTATQQQNTVSLPSPLKDPSQLAQLLPVLLDKVTTTQDTDLPGRINVNTAPQAVLAALPGLSDSDVQAILAARPSLSSATAPDASFQTPAWLVTQASLTPQKVKAMESLITARTQVYRVQAIGYFEGGGPMARVEAIIDTNQGRPRILQWRDLTEMGKAFDVQNP